MALHQATDSGLSESLMLQPPLNDLDIEYENHCTIKWYGHESLMSFKQGDRFWWCQSNYCIYLIISNR